MSGNRAITVFFAMAALYFFSSRGFEAGFSCPEPVAIEGERERRKARSLRTTTSEGDKRAR
jgi:hypothetical protein